MSVINSESEAYYIVRICYDDRHGAYIPMAALSEISTVPESRKIYAAVFKVINAHNVHLLAGPVDWDGLSNDEISIHKIDWREGSGNQKP